MGNKVAAAYLPPTLNPHEARVAQELDGYDYEGPTLLWGRTFEEFIANTGLQQIRTQLRNGKT